MILPKGEKHLEIFSRYFVDPQPAQDAGPSCQRGGDGDDFSLPAAWNYTTRMDCIFAPTVKPKLSIINISVRENFYCKGYIGR